MADPAAASADDGDLLSVHFRAADQKVGGITNINDARTRQRPANEQAVIRQIIFRHRRPVSNGRDCSAGFTDATIVDRQHDKTSLDQFIDEPLFKCRLFAGFIHDQHGWF